MLQPCGLRLHGWHFKITEFRSQQPRMNSHKKRQFLADEWTRKLIGRIESRQVVGGFAKFVAGYVSTPGIRLVSGFQPFWAEKLVLACSESDFFSIFIGMIKMLSDYFMFLLGLGASIAGLITFYRDSYKDLNDQGKYAVLFLGFFSLYFMLINWIQTKTTRKHNGYKEVFEKLNIGFGRIHAIDRLTLLEPERTRTEIMNQLLPLCDSISDAFEKVKGHNVRVSIKVLSMSSGRNKVPTVRTIRRDSRASASSSLEQADSKDHLVSDNSAFDSIYRSIGKSSEGVFYINNQLPFSFNYKNSRLEGNGPIPMWKFIKRHRTWNLEYKSTLVVPIYPLLKNQDETPKLMGFLCVDSPNYLVFNEKYDVEILKGIADALYEKIHKLKSK